MISTPKQPTFGLRRAVYLLFSVAVTVAILGYLFRFVSFNDILSTITNMNAAGLAGFFALSVSMSVFRTWRFSAMLKFSGHRPGNFALFLVVVVRNFFSDLLPARIGTLVYVYLVTNRLRIPFDAAASSFALAFVFDILALAPIVITAALFMGGGGGLSPFAVVVASAALLVISLAVLLTLPFFARVFAAMLYRLRLVPRRRRVSWFRAVSGVAREIERMRRGGIYRKIFVLSLMVRLAKYGAMYFLLYALVAPLGYSLDQLPVPRVLLGLVGPEIAASLPVSGIGGFGAYEGTWALVFELLLFPDDLAKLTALSHHLLTQVYGAILGVLALLLLLVPRIGARQMRGVG